MPTGYTHQIKDGISFEKYALGCARAFGATISMRDDPPDAEIPEKFDESDHHLEKIKEAQDNLNDFLSQKEDDLIARFSKEREETIKMYKNRIKEKVEL